MEKNWLDGKSINGVKIEWFVGDPYVSLKDYEKLLKELKSLKKYLEKTGINNFGKMPPL